MLPPKPQPPDQLLMVNAGKRKSDFSSAEKNRVQKIGGMLENDTFWKVQVSLEQQPYLGWSTCPVFVATTLSFPPGPLWHIAVQSPSPLLYTHPGLVKAIRGSILWFWPQKTEVFPLPSYQGKAFPTRYSPRLQIPSAPWKPQPSSASFTWQATACQSPELPTPSRYRQTLLLPQCHLVPVP